ncbi:MAG: translocation/assembly module TamB domain-containing protein [Flavobacteriales bacterium]|nr:translocation/assembly module TamB domain-containing protein [Flavobacteriales bacterium]MCW8912255.1 translocation/assembly module TamB domain-containing protein [Flavobacteriales bacterium]MCW8937506.1 translocation/assembly module TamB domain-containing protein [Flavobacteriales bacterium]MCW8967169.1 translocation/assembly module TamB domain-containing protein [Flavobacteriales bacterium]MCW8989129.1 translocation/assembly module TamB domain-containing protein [Flavobacteriales bacterium
MLIVTAFIVLVAILASLIVYNNAFQTFLVKKYLNYLAKELNTTISVENVEVSFFNNLKINRLYIEDLHSDTLFYANEIEAKIGVFSLGNNKIDIKKITLNEPFFNLQHHKDSLHNNLFFVINYFSTEEPKDTSTTKWKVKFNNIEIQKGKFTYNNNKVEKSDYGIDYQHVEITYLNTLLKDINFIQNGVESEIYNMSFYEKSGFQLDDLTTDFAISDKGIFAKKMLLKTPNSVINGDIIFATDSFADLSEFITNVNIESHFDSSKVSFRDICIFTKELDCLNKYVILDGDVKGRIDKLKGRNLSITTDDGTYFNGNADVSGIPKPDEIFIYLDIKSLITSKNKLEQIPLYPFVSETFIQLPDNMKHLGNINFKGKVSGFLNDFVAYGNFSTALGNIHTDLALKMKQDKTYYSGKISTRSFHLGKFFEVPKQIGKIALNTKIVGSGFSLKDIDAKLTGKIKKIEIKDYPYSNITVDGNFQNQIFDGFLDMKDENLIFNFNGNVDFSGELPHLQFTSEIKEAKLAKLNLIETKEKMNTRFSTDVKIDLIGNNIDNIVGEIEMHNTNYIDKLDTIFIPNTYLKSIKTNGSKSIQLNSDFATMEVQGNYQFTDFRAIINNIIYTYLPSQNKETYTPEKIINNFIFTASIINTDILTKLFFNDIRLGPNTNVMGEYNSDANHLLISGSADSIIAFGNQFKALKLKGKANNNQLELDVDIDKVLVFNVDSLFMNDFKLSTMLRDDSLITDITWLNDSLSGRPLDASLNNITYFQKEQITSSFSNAYIYLDNLQWQLSDGNTIVIDTNSISISNFKFANENQKIIVDGTISNDNTKQQMDVMFENFNLGLFKSLIPQNAAKLEGIFNGVASLKKMNNELLFTSDLNIKDFTLNDYLIGQGNIKSKWITEKEALNIDAKFFNERMPSIIVYGNYFPNKSVDDNLDFLITLNQTELSILDAYVKDHVAGLNGKATANIQVKGNMKKPQFSGKISLINTKGTVNYLKTKYEVPSLLINVTPDMISFDNALFLDERKNKAFGTATLYHDNFKNFSFDLGMRLEDFMVLNTSRLDNPDYYGIAFASGVIGVNYDQYTSKTGIEANITTSKNTIFNIPLEGNEEIEENKYITFVTKIDSSALAEMTEEEEVDLSNFFMTFDLNITDDAEVRLIFDEKIGDIMKSRGNGNLKLEINSEGDFSIFGDYVVKSGDYLFTLQNVINKRFNLLEGGTIKWNGDPLDAQVDISASYRTRARLYDLLMSMDTSDVLKKRIPVDLVLHMKNSLLAPDINFDIVLPTADEDTKSKVKSILYVSSHEENIQELNRQVFSLLVLNRFLPPPGVDGVAGNAGLEKTATSELLSNQLSNWLSKISNEFDIGVNYRPGDEISPQEFEVALSTQLLNDRLIIDSNFGIADRQNGSTVNQNTNNLIGDVVLEYKISKDGKLRIKAFNKSNQFSLLEINSPYTQGVGLSYKEEFDSIGEFFRSFYSLFQRRTKKQPIND